MTYDSVLSRVRAVQQKRAADNEALNMKDPAEKGTVTPPDHPDGDSDKKKQIPPSATNVDGQEGKALTDKDTNPSSTGKNVPGPVTDGKPKEDAATSPTTPLSKIAGDVNAIMDRIGQLREKQASAQTAASTTPAPAPKQAEAAPSNDEVANGIQLTPEFHMKLASLILEDEEGLQLAEKILRKAAGHEAAQELINAALTQQDAFVRAANDYDAQVKYAAEVEAYQAAQLNEFLKSASDEDRKSIEKFAQVHGAFLSTLGTDWEKAAYMQGAQDAAAMGDAEAEGAPPEIEGGGEGPMGPEEIIALLQEMVQAGEIDEATAAQIAESLAMGAGGGGGEEEVPLPEEAPEEAKAASELFKKIASQRKA